MKTALALATVATFVTAGMATSLALAARNHTVATPKTLTIAMHDPGCHWFMVGTHFTKTATVTGSVRLRNEDEKTLKVASGSIVQRIPVGKTLVVGVGHYAITMVGQAPDDNHLRLTVR
jgi:hypothetical protein